MNGMHCRTIWGGINCNFEPRYDEGAPGAMQNFKCDGGYDPAEILRMMRPLTYVCDVCTACGKQVMRPPK